MKTKQSILFKIIAVVLSVMLLLGTAPLTAYAEDPEPTTAPTAPLETGTDDLTDPTEAPTEEPTGEPDTQPETTASTVPAETDPPEPEVSTVIVYDAYGNLVDPSTNVISSIGRVKFEIIKSDITNDTEADMEELLGNINAAFVKVSDFNAADQGAGIDSLGWTNTEGEQKVIEKEIDGDKFIITLYVSRYLDQNDSEISKYEGSVTAFVSVNNVDKKDVDKTIDCTGPVITIDPFEDTWVEKQTVSFSVSDTNSVDNVSYYKGETLNSLGSGTGDYSFDVTESADEGYYQIYAVDEAGNETYKDVPAIKIDKAAPAVELDSYSNRNGNNEQVWTDGTSTITVTLKITDTESGIDEDGFKINGTACTPTKSGDKYTFVLSDKDHVNADSATITAADNAGKTTDYVTEALLIDTADPAAGDVNVVIDGAETNKIFSILSFGLYHNDDLKLTVKASANGGAPITDIRLYDDGNEITTESNISVSGGLYTREFTLNPKDSEFKLTLSLTDGAGRTTEDNISILDVANLSAEDEDLKSKVNEGVYEIITTTSVPGAEINAAGEDSISNGDNTVYKGNTVVTAGISDPLSGLKDVKFYFGKPDKFTKNDDGTYTINGVNPIMVSANDTYGIGALSGKKTRTDAEYTIPDTTASGAYTFLVKAQNNSGNTAYYALPVYIDNSAPELTDLDYTNDWTNQPVPVTFKVTDVPDVGAGIKSVNVKDKDGVEVPAEDIVDNGSGNYTFYAKKNSEYTISATDNFDYTASASIKPKITRLDTGDPTATITQYSNKTGGAQEQGWSNTSVKVTFKVEDIAAADGGTAVSGIDNVFVTDSDDKPVAQTKLSADTYSIEVSKRDVYTIHVTDKASNETLLATEEIKYDNNKPVFEKIVFRQANANDLKTFGLYKNQPVIAEVYVRSEGGAPISKIDMKNGDASLYTAGNDTDGITKVEGDDLYYKSFPIPENNSAAYNLTVSAMTEATVAASTANFGNMDIYVEDQKLIEQNQELFEVVITTAKPAVNDFAVSDMASAADAAGSENTVYSGETGKLTATIQDDLAGIDKTTLNVKLDGADITANVTATENSDKKITKIDLSYELTSKLSSGEHIFAVTVKNLAGNEKVEEFPFYIDNSAPVISDLTFNGEAAMTDWSKEPVKVAFTVDDTITAGENAYPYSGIDADSFVITGLSNNTAYTASLDDETGKYYFEADLHQGYTVKVKDVFGSESDAAIISADEVLYDNEEPHIENILYNGKADPAEPEVTADGVDVTFTVDDKSDVSAISGQSLSGVINDAAAFTVVVKAVVFGENDSETELDDPAVTPEFVSSNDQVYTYKFNSKANYKYNIYVTDTAGNTKKVTTGMTVYDNTAPEITGFKAEKKAADVILNILSFGFYSNDDQILTVKAADAAPSSGIKEITATYDGNDLTAYGDFSSGGNNDGYTAQQSFVLPISTSAYDPEKLEVTVTDNVGLTGSNKLDEVDNENEPAVVSTFEVVTTKEPATINDITFEYQLGSTKNPADNVTDIYSANINKTVNHDESADGTYTVTIDDALAGINHDSVKVYFEKVEKDAVISAPNASSEVTANATIEPTKDENLTEKIISEKVTYNTPANLETGRYVFYVEATNNSGNPISKAVDIYLDNTDPGFVGDFVYANTEEGAQKWKNEDIKVSFTVTDDPEAYGYYGGVAAVAVKGVSDNAAYKVYDKDNQEAVSLTEGTYYFYATKYQTYEVTVTDKFGRTAIKTTDYVLCDDEAPVISNFTYDGKANAAEADWKNKTDGMTVTFDVDDKSAAQGIEGTWLSGMEKDNNVDTNVSALTVKVTGDTDNSEPNDLTYVYDETNKVFTYTFTSRFYQTYTVEVTDPAENGSTATSEPTKVDTTAPYVTGYNVSVEEQNKVLNILTFGIYSNTQIILTVTAEDKQSACGIKDIIATYDGDLMAFKDVLQVSDSERTGLDDSASTATISFTIPIDNINAYDPQKLSIEVVDRVDNSSARDLDSLNGDDGINKNTDTTDSPFEVVTTRKPATINDITFEYQLGSTKNPADNVTDVYSANINKAKNNDNSADGTYTVTIDDSLAGINHDTVKVYFEKFDKGAQAYTPNGAAEVTADATIEPTTDETNLVGKITSESITYNTPANLETGRYVFYVEATNNSGNPISKAVDIYLDNTDPGFVGGFTYSNTDAETGEQKWQKDQIKVSFTVTDDPEAYGYYGGVADIKVKGVPRGESYDVYNSETNEKNDFSLTQGTYYFYATKYQKYEATVTDKFGRTATKTTDYVLYDDEAPVISNFTYNGLTSADEAAWSNEAKGIRVTFDVDDKSAAQGIEGTWLSGMEKKNDIDTEVSMLAVEVTGKIKKDENGNLLTYKTDCEYNKEKRVFTYSFVSDYNQNYTIVIVDPASNRNSANSDVTKVDVINPSVTGYSVDIEKNPNPGDKILNILTFGIYSNTEIVLTVYAEDPEASSGIKDISAEYNGVALEPKGRISVKKEGQDASASTATKSFTIKVSGDEKGLYDPKELKVTVTDNVDNSSKTRSLYELSNDENIKTKPYPTNGDFEIVASTEAPKFVPDSNGEKITLTPNADQRTVQYPIINGNARYFSGDITASFELEAELTGLQTVAITLNGNDITELCSDIMRNGSNTDNVHPTEYTHNEATEPNDDIRTLSISFSTADENISQYLRRMKDIVTGENNSNGINEIAVTAKGNNGQEAKATASFVIDNAAPKITSIKFGKDGKPFTPGEVEEIVQVTSYGYFFKEETEVYITAEDYNKDNEGLGSGVNKICLFGDSLPQLNSNDFDVIEKEISDNTPFTVSAGFKGMIYAYAVDNVKNKGATVAPDGVIVESEAQHKEASGATITVRDTNQVNTDNNGNRLFNGTATVDLEVKDVYSGIHSITYSINSDVVTDIINLKEEDIKAGIVDGWTIVEHDNNLATVLRKTISVRAEDYNLNDIKIKLSAEDNARFPITGVDSQTGKDESVISIDTTPPEITVEYNPEAATHTFNGQNYFNVNRTMTITVKERNFNSADFKISSIMDISNPDNTVPAFRDGAESPAVSWIDYSDYTDNSIHKATVTFDTDGKFWVQLDYTDMAKNKANHYGPTSQISDSRDIFYIDKTRPVVQVNITSSVSPSNGNYYNDTVTANITVTEHNFDTSYLVTFTPDFRGPDNVAVVTGPSIDWSSGSEGDVHRGTITFSRDELSNGKFSFRLKYKDLADNESDEAVQDTFYVDAKKDTPKVDDVRDKQAYDGTVTPKVVLEDYNFDLRNYTIKVTKLKYDVATRKFIKDVYTNKGDGESITTLGTIVENSNANGFTGAEFTFFDIPNEDDFDGIYTIESFYTDLAGNTSETETITFSVNRFGAVFIPGDKETEDLINNYYTNDPSNVFIKVINATDLKNNAMSLTYNSGSVALNDSDYRITSAHNQDEWYQWDYIVNSNVFEKEGEFTLTITAEDEFGNTVSNRTAVDTTSVTRTCPVSFVVDKTPPEIQITGVVDKKDYSEDTRTIHIVCTDININKDSVIVNLNGEDYNAEQLVKKFNASIDDSLVGELDINFTLDAKGQEAEYVLKAAIDDLATNEKITEDVRFTLSATFWTMFFHNTAAVIITSVVLLALIGLAIFLIMKKRKQKA